MRIAAKINKPPPIETAAILDPSRKCSITLPKNKEAMISGITIKKLKIMNYEGNCNEDPNPPL